MSDRDIAALIVYAIVIVFALVVYALVVWLTLHYAWGKKP